MAERGKTRHLIITIAEVRSHTAMVANDEQKPAVDKNVQ